VACAPRYRTDVLACFLAPGGLALDGRPASRAELDAARLRGPVRAARPPAHPALPGVRGHLSATHFCPHARLRGTV